MIENDLQYQITKTAIAGFESGLSAIERLPSPGVHPSIYQAQLDAMRSMIEDLRGQIAAWETKEITG